MSEIIENKMGVQPIGRLLFTMSLPAIISMTLQAVYNVVDSLFVSWVSEDALAAVTLVFPLQMLTIAVGVGTGVGLNSLISRRLGEKRFDEANLAATHGYLLIGFSWLIFLLIGAFLSRPFFQWYSDSQDLVEMSVSYCQIILCGSLFLFAQTTAEKILQGTGNMIVPMITNIIGCVTNIILDPIMIFGLFGFPKMGVSGAAIATVIGQAVGCLAVQLCFFFGRNQIKVTLRNFRFKMRVIRDIYVVALPGMIMQMIPSFVTIFLNMILIGFSVTAVSVLGVYFRLQSFVFMPVFGTTQGAMPIMGYNFGARNRKRLLHAVRLCGMATAGIMLLGLIVFQIFPGELMAMFNASGEMMEMGVAAMHTLSLCFIPAAVGITFATFFQALGYGIYSLLVTLMRQIIVLLPVAFILSGFIGVMGVWMAFPIAETVGLSCSIFFFIRIYRKEVSILPEGRE